MAFQAERRTMSAKLLIDEPPLQVLPSLACLRTRRGRLGVTAAIVLQQLHWRAQRTDDGWVQRSISAWRNGDRPRDRGDFPFWDDATIKRAFTRLEAEGLIEREQSASTDRTRRYRVRYDELRAREPGVQIAPLEGGRPPADRPDASVQDAPFPIEGENGKEGRGEQPPSGSSKVTTLRPRRRGPGSDGYDGVMERC
jgi:hypothetical protein